MASVITIAGEQLFAAKAQANEQLDIDTFIFAHVPNQDPTAPINREEGIPTTYIVHQQIVQQVGRINENVVVYSTVLDSLIGQFDFNWVGLYSSVNQKLVAVNHVPTVTKTATESGAAGNTLNRNFGIEYSGIADLTGITVAPETWQLDFTARLSGMDELTRQLAADMNGKDWFIEDGFKVVPRATVNTFSVTSGVGYVSGLRVELKQEHILTLQTYPQFVYIDAWFSGTANSTWTPQIAFTVTNGEMDDYIDPIGGQHYVYKLAVVNADDNVEDLRSTQGLIDKINSTRRNATVKEVEKGVFKEGEKLTLTDRDNEPFDVVKGNNHDGWSILDAGNGNVAVIQPKNGVVSGDGCGAFPEPYFDSYPAIISAWKRGKIVKLNKSKSYYLGSELRYPSNAYELHGVQSAPFSSSTTILPIDNTFSDAVLIDMNENGSDTNIPGGQFNVLKNLCVQGGMASFVDKNDPLVNLIGVRGINTIDACRMENVSFRLCGKPFEFTGWKHKHKQIEVYQCYTGGDLASTNSSVIDGYHIQTCAKNWGTLERCTINNATLQQGNEKQTLDDDTGVFCIGLVEFTGYLYTEGGNAQISVADEGTTIVQNWLLGFAQLLSGNAGNYNVKVGDGSSIIVNGGRSNGIKSFLIGGTPELAKNIHLDILDYDGRVINSVTSEELPYCPNLFLRRSYGSITRKNYKNDITLTPYAIGTSTKAVWDQFSTDKAQPFGGEITVHVGGSNSYDLYKVDFTDATASDPLVKINTIFRNTGGSGDNNINLTYEGGVLTAQGRKSDQKVGITVNAYGSMWPTPII